MEFVIAFMLAVGIVAYERLTVATGQCWNTLARWTRAPSRPAERLRVVLPILRRLNKRAGLSAARFRPTRGDSGAGRWRWPAAARAMVLASLPRRRWWQRWRS